MTFKSKKNMQNSYKDATEIENELDEELFKAISDLVKETEEKTYFLVVFIPNYSALSSHY